MGWEWGSLYSSAQRPSLTLSKTQLEPTEATSSKKSAEPLVKPFWRHLLEQHGLLPHVFTTLAILVL